jgi:Probable taurine catabolism dioxygenase
MELLESGASLPVVIRALVDGLNLAAWSKSNRDLIETQLLRAGAILFRGFEMRDAADLERLIVEISGELLEYRERSTPRTPVSGNIYTSTEYPASQFIPLHNEMAYTTSWPMKIWFMCVKAAASGGETPIADSRQVFHRLDGKVREQFIRRKVMYVRNYGEGLDLPWRDVFQTNDRAYVESFCRRVGIEFQWKDGDGLRTRHVCQAAVAHPRSGEMVWFNQAHLFHVSSLSPEVRDLLQAAYDPEDYPRNAYYGDGQPIETSALEAIRAAYEEEAVKFAWQEGDVLMADNMLVAHGRTPFSGLRKIVVGMAELYESADGGRGGDDAR